MSAPAATEALGWGHVSGAALFALAIGIMLWPMARRLLEAHRQRVALEALAGSRK